MKTIEITISPAGQTSVETKGFSGAECRQASEFIETALGQRTGERLTGEFYAQEGQPQQLQEGA
ncbi:MAG TPA: DUF2997 domain-containing protein [Planctomycetaceae bacterium]|nr:DUF2997 domain-containing protein [Planctomycetaceae bacterium]